MPRQSLDIHVNPLALTMPTIHKRIVGPTCGERKELAMPQRPSSSRVNTQGNQLAKALGRRLRYLRAQTGLTQLELSRIVSMHRTYISRVESGRILPRYVTLVRLAESLGVSVAELVRDAPCSSSRSNMADTARL